GDRGGVRPGLHPVGPGRLLRVVLRRGGRGIRAETGLRTQAVRPGLRRRPATADAGPPGPVRPGPAPAGRLGPPAGGRTGGTVPRPPAAGTTLSGHRADPAAAAGGRVPPV